MTRATHQIDDPAAHVSRSLAETDPSVRATLDSETARQGAQIELIASENIMSRAVREALGHEIGNKTLEGLSLPFIPSIAETLEFWITTGYPFQHA